MFRSWPVMVFGFPGALVSVGLSISGVAYRTRSRSLASVLSSRGLLLTPNAAAAVWLTVFTVMNLAVRGSS